jgi:hypothetical protein
LSDQPRLQGSRPVLASRSGEMQSIPSQWSAESESRVAENAWGEPAR